MFLRQLCELLFKSARTSWSNFVRSIFGSFVCLFVCLFLRSFIHLFVCTFVCLFACSFVCLFICRSTFCGLNRLDHPNHSAHHHCHNYSDPEFCLIQFVYFSCCPCSLGCSNSGIKISVLKIKELG